MMAMVMMRMCRWLCRNDDDEDGSSDRWALGSAEEGGWKSKALSVSPGVSTKTTTMMMMIITCDEMVPCKHPSQT